MFVRFLCFVINAIKSDIDNIPTASTQRELPLPSHPPLDRAKCLPFAVARTQPKLISCVCRTNPSDTAIKCPSLLCAQSTSSIVMSIHLYLLSSAANETNLVKSPIHLDCLASNRSNDSAGPLGTFSSTAVVSSSAPGDILDRAQKVLMSALQAFKVLV